MATRSIVPRADNEGGIGTSIKRWFNAFFKFLDISESAKFTSLSSQPTHEEGKVFYDGISKSLSYYNENAEVTVNMGRETLIRVKNTTGSNILNGQVVKVIGSDAEDLPLIDLAKADTTANSKSLGVATSDINNNGFGYVTINGIVRDLDLSSFTNGDKVFLSDTVAGGITITSPSIEVFIGYVLKNDSVNGNLLVGVSESFQTTGDMQKAIYDTDNNGIVDTADAIKIDYIEDNTETSTTSTTFQDKVTLNVNLDSAGDYLLSWQTQLATNQANKITKIRILQDTVETIVTSATINAAHPIFELRSGFSKVSLASGTHSFKLQFSTDSVTYTSFLKDSRIYLKKVTL